MGNQVVVVDRLVVVEDVSVVALAPALVVVRLVLPVLGVLLVVVVDVLTDRACPEDRVVLRRCVLQLGPNLELVVVW